MTCGEIRQRLDETSTAAEFRFLSSDPAVRQHLDECPACRREFAGEERLWQGLENAARLAERLPEQAVEAVRTRTSGALLWGYHNRRPAAVLPFLQSTSGRRWAWGLGAVAAGAIILGVAALLLGPRAGHSQVAQAPHQTPVHAVQPKSAPAPVPVAASAERRKVPQRAAKLALDPHGRLQQLNAEFDRQKTSGKGVSFAFPNEIVGFLATEGLDQELEMAGYDLLARAYHATGELQEERDAFLRCLDLYEAKWGAEKAAEQVRYKVDSLVHGENDESLALTYADIILTRYAETSLLPYAIHRTATYYRHMGRVPEALAVFQQLEDEHPGVPETTAAIREKAEMLFNAGKHAEAYAVLANYIQGEPRTAEKAQARFTIGFYKYAARDFAGALNEFHQTVAEFPGTDPAKQAEGMLKLVRKQTVDSLDRNL